MEKFEKEYGSVDYPLNSENLLRSEKPKKQKMTEQSEDEKNVKHAVNLLQKMSK